MNRNDWIGLGTSLGLHVLVFVIMALIAAATPEPEQLGFIEVELGTFSEGRPVQKAEQPKAQPEPKQPEQRQQRAEAKPRPPREAKQVQLPKQQQDLPDPDKVQSPRTEVISPEAQNNPDEVRRDEPQEETPAAQPQGSGARDGTSGAAEGAQGEGTDATKAAPFLIEGLNRDAVFAPLPPYREKVNALIKFRIEVDPRGKVISASPVLKANPALEAAVRDVLLQRWRFNPLPASVPQVNQSGTVTFRFRLE